MTPEGRSSVLSSGKCPRCGRRGRVVFMSTDGTTDLSRTQLWRQNLRLVSPEWKAFWAGKYPLARCELCNGTWQICASSALIQTGSSPRVWITETSRTEEPLGDDLLRVNNVGSTATLTRRLKISKRWQQNYEVQIERAHTANGKTTWGSEKLVQFQTTTEDAVKRHYKISGENEQTLTEEIEVTVPPGIDIEIRLRWKRLWQEGYATVADGSGTTVDIPYRAVVGVTFDQPIVTQ
jgi:hypothetical protein